MNMIEDITMDELLLDSIVKLEPQKEILPVSDVIVLHKKAKAEPIM